MTKARMFVDVSFDERVTDAEALACALDRLMETAMSIPGVLDEYGNPTVGEFRPLQIESGGRDSLVRA